MTQLEDFKHQISITARFADADMMGHVNNATYVTYVEEARINYARDVLGWGNEADTLGMILARTEIDYLLPLKIGEAIRVYTRCSRIGRKSFTLEYAIVKDVDDALVATCVTAMVAFDYKQGRSIAVSDRWRELILAFESTPPEPG